MTIDLSPLNYSFQQKPLLIGGQAMQWYGLRPAGDDIDFVITQTDYTLLAAQYPEHTKDLYGDLGICVEPFELWTSILLFDYAFLAAGAHELEQIRIVSLEKLLFLKTLFIAEPKSMRDMPLLVQKINDITYGKDPQWPPESLRPAASLPTKRMAAGALIRNAQGDLLIVKPTYRPDWLIPGGVVELHESPLQACQREVQEELGIQLPITRLLCLEYQPQVGQNTENLQFIFDGSTLTDAHIAQITLPAAELASFQLVPPTVAQKLLAPRLARRIAAILAAPGAYPLYLEAGSVVS